MHTHRSTAEQRADRRAMVIAALGRRRERDPLNRRRELLSAFTRRANNYYATPDYVGVQTGHE